MLVVTLVYLTLVVLIPLSGVFVKSATLTPARLWDTISDPRVLASYRLTFGVSLVAALVNAVIGFPTAWVLARYKFPGKRILDACVDLPFAIPTAVAGITLATLYAEHGIIGSRLAQFGIKVAYTPLGIIVALVFVGLPFVVRSVQPVIEELDRELEDAAATLGAAPWQTFTRVIFPAAWPALLTGFSLALARALGEYGSVVFISGNMPMKTEITTLLIVSKLEGYDYAGAAAIASVMLVASFLLLVLIQTLQARTTRRSLP
jgi:sulfate transport system permease protein